MATKSKRTSSRVAGTNNGGPANPAAPTKTYSHLTETAPLRPDIGTQAQFRKRRQPAKYSYDSSLAPALDWDGQNAAREQGEHLIREILDAPSLDAARDAARRLARLSKPFLNWSGKAERLSFDVPSLPLFVHERLSTSAILETLRGHRHDAAQRTLFDLFGDPERSITDQILKPYEHGPWQNRMLLGDSLVVMNSLLEYEGMGGKVQMIYMDPPYGVKFGSNFQPFVRKRDVTHGDDEDMTREPEMVQAYRDTWELGLHSYLTYLRDRLKIARELLTPSGSVFVQISDENVHHLREVLDEVFGLDQFCAIVSVNKTSGLGATLLQSTQDFILWYAKDRQRLKFRQLFTSKTDSAEIDAHYTRDSAGKLYTLSDLTAQNNDVASCIYEYEFKSSSYRLPRGRQWKTTRPGLDRLVASGRVVATKGSLRYVRFLDDFPASVITDAWHDIGGSVQSRSDPKIYVVQTGAAPIQRCLLMTTDPGDLVLDPTCGSGTTAYVAEQWGRRWITCDVSRVPLALARQRLLTATFSYYKLVNESRGPSGGFVYQRKQNRKGEEIGGIVPHVTLKSIANNEPPDEEVLVDRPEVDNAITRITGPFCFESTIPAPLDFNSDSETESAESPATLPARMIEILRKSPVLNLPGNQKITLKNIRPPARSLSLSAEAVMVNGEEENGGGGVRPRKRLDQRTPRL